MADNKQARDGTNALFTLALKDIGSVLYPLNVLAKTDGAAVNPIEGIAIGASITGKLGTMSFGRVTTSTPSYLNDELRPISLDAAGAIKTVITTSVSTADVGLNVAATASIAGRSGPPVQMAITTSAPSYTTGQINWISGKPNGDLRTNDADLNAATGVQADAAWTAGSGSVVALLKAIAAKAIGSATNAAQVQGPGAAGSGVAGNPFGMALRAMTALPTTQSSASTIYALGTAVGALVNKPYSIPESDWSYAAAASGIVNTTTAVTAKAAAAAGLRNYVTSMQLDWDALTNATEVAIRDGVGGTVLWRGKLPAGAVGRRDVSFPCPLKGTAATLLEVVTLTASGAGGVFVNLQGYVAP